MTTTMIREFVEPAPSPGQVLVRMETCGICHTDIPKPRVVLEF